MLQHIYTSDGVRTVEIPDPTPDEIQAEAARIEQHTENLNREIRDRLLLESDWTQGTDSPLTDVKKTEWATYRTSLRNLTDHDNWPSLGDEDWPTKPS